MNNHKEKVDVLKRMFERVCGPTKINIRFEEDMLNIENGTFGISETEIEVKSIRGIMKVPGYALDRAETFRGFNGEPGDVDWVEIFADRNFLQVAKAAVLAWIEMQLDSHIDYLDTESQVKELLG